jgi:STE24 endopeptidase
MALSLVVLLVLALTTLGARLASWAWPGPDTGWWPLRLLAATLAVTLLVRLVTLPTSAQSHRVSARYGLSTQGWGAWLLDAAKSWALGALTAYVGIAVLVLLARRWPGGWWLPAAALAAGAVVLISFLYPVVVEPLFNKFTPMPQGELRTSLVQLADEDGLPVKDVLVADASRRTTALNAYVSGFGATRRIVVYDTLLEKATPEEVRLVVAHELGHAKHRDVVLGTALGALGAATAVVLLYLVLTSGWFLRRAGVDDAGDPRIVALVLASVSVMTLVAMPVQNLVSRRIEARADVHALDLTRDPATFAAMQSRLALTNLSDLDPNPVVYGLFATHPTAPERIAIARSWARLQGVTEP